MKGGGDAAEHAEGMALVGGRFHAADLLLGGFQARGQFFLREAGILTQPGDLEGDIPSFARGLEPLGKLRVLKLFLKVAVEIGLPFHAGWRCSQSLRRALAVSSSWEGK